MQFITRISIGIIHFIGKGTSTIGQGHGIAGLIDGLQFIGGVSIGIGSAGREGDGASIGDTQFVGHRVEGNVLQFITRISIGIIHFIGKGTSTIGQGHGIAGLIDGLQFIGGVSIGIGSAGRQGDGAAIGNTQLIGYRIKTNILDFIIGIGIGIFSSILQYRKVNGIAIFNCEYCSRKGQYLIIRTTSWNIEIYGISIRNGKLLGCGVIHQRLNLVGRIIVAISTAATSGFTSVKGVGHGEQLADSHIEIGHAARGVNIYF